MQCNAVFVCVSVSLVRRTDVCWHWMESFSVQTETSVRTRKWWLISLSAHTPTPPRYMSQQLGSEVERQGRAKKSTTPRSSLCFQGKEEDLPWVGFGYVSISAHTPTRPRCLHKVPFSLLAPKHRASAGINPASFIAWSHIINCVRHVSMANVLREKTSVLPVPRLLWRSLYGWVCLLWHPLIKDNSLIRTPFLSPNNNYLCILTPAIRKICSVSLVYGLYGLPCNNEPRCWWLVEEMEE